MVLIWLTRRNLRREKSDADPDAAGRRVGRNPMRTNETRAEKRTDREAPITTDVYGDWSEAREQIAAEIEAAVDGTPAKIELRTDGKIDVQYKDTDDIWITMEGGVDDDDLPAGCTFDGVHINRNDTVTIVLNHRGLN